jgi:rubredoxin
MLNSRGDSKSTAFGREGSNPSRGTTMKSTTYGISNDVPESVKTGLCGNVSAKPDECEHPNKKTQHFTYGLRWHCPDCGAKGEHWWD